VKHILFLDPLNKLVIKKDSTLQLALTLKELGKSVFLLFENDFYISNFQNMELKLCEFSGSFKNNSCYLDTFQIMQEKEMLIEPGDLIHMRLDPPFDTRYLRHLWKLSYLKSLGINVLNDPQGILLYNEKLLAFEYREESITSFIGQNEQGFLAAIKAFKEKGASALIFKPLDLYQGLGVEKIELNQGEEQLKKIFNRKVKEATGDIIVQPFIEEVTAGEVRAFYFKGKEIGSILKVPKAGDFMANIAQGAAFSPHKLSPDQAKICEKISNRLMKSGVDWVAYDLLGDKVSEVNITCPGLLVEISEAHGENLAKKIIAQL